MSEACLEPVVEEATSSFHLTLGFRYLDSILSPLIPGHLVMLAREPASTIAELIAFRAQLPVKEGGFGSAVFFVDGGNKSDPYRFDAFAKQMGIKPRATIKGVTACRAFTPYQLVDLTRDLVHTAEDYSAKLVVISDLLATFNEPGLDESDAMRMLHAIRNGIERVKRDVLVIATVISTNKYDDVTSSWADTMVSLSSSGLRVTAELLKHTNMSPVTSSFKLGELLEATETRGL